MAPLITVLNNRDYNVTKIIVIMIFVIIEQPYTISLSLARRHKKPQTVQLRTDCTMSKGR